MKVAIDAGHGLYTAGKRCLASIDPQETREWVLNSRVAEYVEQLLNLAGMDTVRTDDPSGQTDVPLSTRCQTANAAGCDYFVSIHHNAGINGGTGGGPVVFVYSGTHSAESDVLQAAVYNGIVNSCGKFGNRATPLAASNLYVLRNTSMPAVLVECGFMDSTQDTPLILTDDFARQCAEGIASGVAAMYGLTIDPEHEIPVVDMTPGDEPEKDVEPESDPVESYVAKFQVWLAAGLDIDGIFGPKTKQAAVAAYQRELNTQFGAGLSVDGIFGAKTQAATGNVKQGARGNLTRILQGILYCKGYDPQGFDGIFGSGCAAAVKSFQAAQGLTADGIAGKQTWAALLK